MTAAGFILIGLAAGMLIGALAAYGFMFIWAIKCGRGGRRMSTPLEQARAIAMARHFLSELCVPGKIKRVPLRGPPRGEKPPQAHAYELGIWSASLPNPVQC
jgi:hypothetical protein